MRPANTSTPPADHRTTSPVRYIRDPAGPNGHATNRSPVSPGCPRYPRASPPPPRYNPPPPPPPPRLPHTPPPHPRPRQLHPPRPPHRHRTHPPIRHEPPRVHHRTANVRLV